AGEHDVVFHFAAFNIMPSTINYRPLGAVSNTHNTIIVRTNRITGRTFSLGMEGVSYALAETDEEDYFFVRERQSVYPETIQIDGPAEILDRIAFIEVESRFVAPLTDTTTQAGSLRIYDIDGDRIPPEDLADVLLPDGTQLAYASVSATVVVRMVRMVQLRPVFEPGAGASEENISYRLSQETVRLIGDSEVLRGLPYLELAQIRLDRVGLVDSIRLDIPIPGLTEILDGPEHVDVEIQILDVVEREMTIPRSRILIAGEPEGMNAVVELDTITLIIRGPADTLEELDESDISVLVNLADYVGQTGRFLVEDFMVLVDDWPTYVVGARNRQGQGIVVNLQRNS
ncbi:MAG: hypothetical protein FWD84_07300, partial [Oscillospiraceae bacterium]|nr:hypothetical protein [Oscillospiraceae bacterium]